MTENNFLIESEKNGNKPSFSYQENPKTIRTIKPETVAQAVLNLLKINFEINFKTLRIGDFYHIRNVEIVPNFKANIQDYKNNLLYIRADLYYDDECIKFWCANYKCRIISATEIPISLIKQFSQNIDHIFFKLKDTSISSNYFNLVKKSKVNFTLCFENEEKISEIRNFYFHFKVENDQTFEKIKKIKKQNGKFLTNKILLSNGIAYPSEAHLNANKKLDITNEVIYDQDAFWKDVEHFYIYDIGKSNKNSESKIE
jgi:hypothetical protein